MNASTVLIGLLVVAICMIVTSLYGTYCFAVRFSKRQSSLDTPLAPGAEAAPEPLPVPDALPGAVPETLPAALADAVPDAPQGKEDQARPAYAALSVHLPESVIGEPAMPQPKKPPVAPIPHIKPLPLDSLWVRSLVILGIALALFIPRAFVESIVDERADMQREARDNMLQGWGRAQVVAGPALVIPYDTWLERSVAVKKGKKNDEVEYVTERYKSALFYKIVLPKTVDFKAVIEPVERYYGIYATTVYESPIQVQGRFVLPAKEEFDKDVATVYWTDATFGVGVAELKSLSPTEPLVWNGETMSSFSPNTKAGDILGSGFHTAVPLHPEKQTTGDFSFSLRIRGADKLHFTPVGEISTIAISGAWKDPSFSGQILPTSRTITDKDFTASWSIPHLSRSYPQVATMGEQEIDGKVLSFSIGVDLYEPVTLYRMVLRSVKYGLLFIGLTYAALFSFEISRGARLHYLQYGLVGVSMMVFYLVLLSLAEHTSFLYSFIAASAVTILMNSMYIAAAMRSKKQGVIIGAILAALYCVLYVLLGMEKFALLVGTGLVLVLVGVLMVVTRNLPVGTGKEGAPQ